MQKIFQIGLLLAAGLVLLVACAPEEIPGTGEDVLPASFVATEQIPDLRR
jgi:hypothetical protein